jgi:predicted amidohydrolase YtcJ
MLIKRAELLGRGLNDVRIDRGVVIALGNLAALQGEEILDAHGGLLLPGLHDHHIHVAALAASLTSVHCGPPEITDIERFRACLQIEGKGWLRAIGYHESIAGMLDAATLDSIVADRPVRVQHRSGRMWFFNSAGLEKILAGRAPPAGLEQIAGRYTGRLFDEDAWLKQALKSEPPSFKRVGELLAQAGVTGITEMSPGNDEQMAGHFMAEHASGSLPQRVLLAGKLCLSNVSLTKDVELGPAKLHLHEAELPALEETVEFIRAAHEQTRNVAIHCVSEVELVYALQAVQEAGARAGDRIEHASVAPDFAVETIARLGLAVVTQPQFIYERGDIYLQEVDTVSQRYLYRLRAFLDAHITLAAGSDAPFGAFDPWLAMAHAVSRRTRDEKEIEISEALTPEESLKLYLSEPKTLDRQRSIEIGAPADLCLLDRPWCEARKTPSSTYVRATFIDGRKVFDRSST